MKLLAEISDGTLGISGEFELFKKKYELRKSARAVLLNNRGEIAIQYLQNYSYHKLPGGGVDTGETVEQALKREVLEEVGCDSEIERLLGVTIEYRNKYDLIHVSYCFVAKSVGDIGEPKLEECEIEEGQVTLWLPPTEVLEKMENDKPKKYEGLFILEREKTFISEFLSSQ